MATNPNWPLLQICWSPFSNGTFDHNTVRYTDVTWRAIKQWTIARGRQYELNQILAGNYNAVFDNTDGAFDPTSAQSVFAKSVLPYRQLQVSAQWPPTQNLLTKDQSTAGEQTFPSSISTVGSAWPPVHLFPWGLAFQGTQVYWMQLPSGATNDNILYVHVPIEAYTVQQIRPAQTYTFSCYVSCFTTGQNPKMSARIQYFDANGAGLPPAVGTITTVTGNPSTTWTRLTVTGTVPVGAVTADLDVFLESTFTTTATTDIFVDGLQFETGSVATAYTVPGNWYPMITAGVERYPMSYDLSGTRTVATVTATDAFALLPQSLLEASFTGLVTSPGGPNQQRPTFIYPFTESSSSTTFSDSTGQFQPAVIVNSQAGAGTISPGQPITSVTPGQGFVGAGNVTVTHITSPGAAGTNFEVPMSTIALAANPNGQFGPGGGTGRNFTRMIAFRLTAAPTVESSVWGAGGGLSTAANLVAFSVESGTNNAEFRFLDSHNIGGFTLGPVTIGDWHLAMFGVDAAGHTFFCGIDGAYSAGTFATPYNPVGGFINDYVGTGDGFGNPVALFFNMQGDVAYATEWPYLLSSSQVTAIYNAWRTAYVGDPSNLRISRILDWGGFSGPRAIDTGQSTSLGAATDVDGQDILTALQNVTDTEGGEQFIARDGTYTFYNRNRRFQSQKPVVVFGENTAGGEIPYESLVFDFDPTLIENSILLTQVSTSAQFRALNAASQTSYGVRSYSKSNQSTVAQEVQDQATYLANTFSYPKSRAAALKIHPASNPSVLWPVCLGLELGQYVQINRRPSGSQVGALAQDTIFGFVENIAWSANNGADATVTLQVSPAPGTGGGPSQAAAVPWNLALLHTTIHATASAGQPTIVIDALPTAALSTLAQNLPGGGPGMQLTIGDGLAIQETLTIQSVSATSLGYSTATITFTTNLANNHAAGEVVREGLGSAVEATWLSLDVASKTDSMMPTY